MKTIFPILITLLLLVSCNNSTKNQDNKQATNEQTATDTIIVRIENKIDKSDEFAFYSKSVKYCWVTNKDTLDFMVGVNEQAGDSSVSIRTIHYNPILFTKALDKINECLPLIAQDFNLNKLNGLYFAPPIFYKDLTNELSNSYENKFGNKSIKFKEMNEFLMNSWLQERVEDFLQQFNKSIKRYGIEKYHFLEKKYYNQYIPNKDLDDYPSFSIHGMGMSVILNE